MKRVGIIALLLIAAFVALFAFVPLVAASLLTAILAPVLSGVAFVANLVVPAEERSFRIEALVTLDGSEHRAVGVATCRRRFETYGAEGVFFDRRLRTYGGHVALNLPDQRQVQSSAFLVCSDDEYAKVKDSIAFYLIDRRTTPVRAQYTSVPRSAANPAAPFRVAIVSAGPSKESAQGGASHLPDYSFAVPPAIEHVKNSLTSYIAQPIPKEVWSADDKLRADYAAITELRAVRKPPDDVLKRLIAQTSFWPASGALAPDHSRVDFSAFGPPLPVAYVAIETSRPRGSGRPPQYPVPQICFAERCVRMPVTPYGLESVHAREGFLFDPVSQNLIAIRAIFAGIYDPGKTVFMPR